MTLNNNIIIYFFISTNLLILLPLTFTGTALISDKNVSPANKIRRFFSPMIGLLSKCCSPNIIAYY